MNISRRSIEFSLILHCALLVIGIAWLVLFIDPPTDESKRSVRLVKVTPLKLLSIPVEVKKPPAQVQISGQTPAPRKHVATLELKSKTIGTPEKEPARLKVKSQSNSSPVLVKTASLQIPSSYPKAAPKAKAPVAVATTKVGTTRKLYTGTAKLLEGDEPDLKPKSGLSGPTPDLTLGGGLDSAPLAPSSPSPNRVPASSTEARLLGRLQLQAPAFLALKSGYIEAKFTIKKDGSSSVRLVEKTGVEEADQQVLDYLKTLKWAPKIVNGVAVDDVVDMEFNVEQ